jgi:hypothetical protein
VGSSTAVRLPHFALVCLFAAPCVAQFTSAVQGFVRDPSGAVIPGATLRLASRDTGVARLTRTSPEGFYYIAGLAAGSYELTTRSQGFQLVSVEFPLATSQTVEVNVSLGLPSVVVSETVISAVPLLSTQDASTGQQIYRPAIESLPLIDRSVFSLVYLAPGVAAPPGGDLGHPNNFHASGSRNATSDVLLDGVSTVNYEQNSGAQLALYTPAVDAIQEFRLQSNFTAEHGFSGATVVSVVTRSGSNQFHGGLYHFLRNDKLDANDYFSNRNGVSLPPLRRNQFGGSAGGPLSRSRTFFFADYEGTRVRSLVTKTAGVPSAAMRAGDFSELCTARGGAFDPAGRCSAAGGQLWDPYSGVYRPELGGPERTAFIPFNNLATYISPGSPRLDGTPYQVPLSPGNLIDPVAQKMLALFPQPNLAVGSSSYTRFANWIGSGANVNNRDQFDLKIDHHAGSVDQLSAKLALQRFTYHRANLFGNYGDVYTQGPGDGHAYMAALNHSHAFNAQTLLMAAYGVTRHLSWTHGVLADYPTVNPVRQLGLPSYLESSGVTAPPALFVGDGYSALDPNASVGGQPWAYMKYGQEIHHFSAVVSHNQGRHELRAGAESRIHRISFLQAAAPAGMYMFDYTGSSRLPNGGGGDAMASALMGVGAPAWSFYEIPAAVSTQSIQYALFSQHNWRATPNLTFNLGLRYDLDFPRTERFNRMSWISLGAVSPVLVPGLDVLHGALVFANPVHRYPYDLDADNFAPRFGLAWQPRPRGVVRGGCGIFYSLSKGGASGTGAGGFQGFSQNTRWQTTYQNDGVTPFARLSDPFPNGVLRPRGYLPGPSTGLGSGIAGPIPSWNATPYEQSWNLGFQTLLPFRAMLDASYLGRKGTKLYFGGAGSLNFLPAASAERFRQDPASMNAMVANPFYGLPDFEAGGLSGPLIPAWRLSVPYPQFSSVTGNDPPWANSIYHALQVRFERPFSDKLQWLVTYTASKSIDDASVSGANLAFLGGFTSLQDPNNRRLERSLSLFDISQILQFSYVYRLPFVRTRGAQGMRRLLDIVLGGWQTNGLWRFSTGTPIALHLRGGRNLPTYGSQRPDLLETLRKNPVFSLDRYFANPEVVVRPADYQNGTAPRTLPNLRAPGVAEGSISIFKDFPIRRLGDGARLEYRLEAFNALNHVRFCGPDATAGNATFGQTTCQANTPREVQMALKLHW